MRGQQGPDHRDGHLPAELVTNVAAFIQLAALAAITGPQDHIERVTERLQVERDKMVTALNAMPGIVCPTPAGSSTSSRTSATRA